MEDAIRSFLERYRSADDFVTSPAPDIFDDAPRFAVVGESTAMVPALDVSAHSIRIDGARALHMVEQAAELIKDYERKFQVIEADARSYVRRVDKERSDLNAQLEALQMRLDESEMHARSIEQALQQSLVEVAEARLERKALEARLEVAVAEVHSSSAYFQSIQEKLSGAI